ncbi:hypothetical protein E4U32_000434 [Claviceps aff. humidiphila group G2b]|nr:hypothetical protein E4U32_000434 [Claviceps aff. humidiphila group G2b]
MSFEHLHKHDGPCHEHKHNGPCHAILDKLDPIVDGFRQVELEMMRINEKMTRDLYAKREKVISEIPNFWPRVFRAAPPEIDKWFLPLDAKVIRTALKNLTVERFELPDGDPRSFSLKFEFAENEYFENSVLEKKFWWRCAMNDWEGYVSEPVEIKWKPGKDLTGGLVDIAKKIYEELKVGNYDPKSPAREALIKKFRDNSLDTYSFFNMFGYRGRYISAEESAAAFMEVEEKRQARKEGRRIQEQMEDAYDDDDQHKFEVLPDVNELAIAIAEDLYPEAMTYYLEADDEDDFDDEDEDEDEDEDDFDDFDDFDDDEEMS